MSVRWTTDAVDDLERICDYLADARPESARQVAHTLVEGISALKTFSHRGRPGRIEDTRELVFVSLPFVAVYQVQGEDVVVLRILQGAQEWPPP